MRLQKYLAMCGIASRRAAEAMITAGRVRVNGAVIDHQGYIVQEGDRVEADGSAVSPPNRLLTIMLNKPQGIVTTAHDPQGRTTVLDLIDTELRLFPIGRLDYDTEGLLLLTNDGALAHALTHPSRSVSKTYQAIINGRPANSEIKRLESGILLDDGHKTAPAAVELLSQNAHVTKLLITVHEGHNRLIRRMCAAIGCPIVHLSRLSIGPLSLGSLKSGQWRKLSEKEVEGLRGAAGGNGGTTRASGGKLS